MSLAIKRTVKCLCFFLLLIVAAGVALGQDASSALTGIVTDPSGAAVANARVVATPATGSPVNVRTNANGMYEFKTLPPGVYTLRATAKGFEPFVKAGVTVEPGKPISVNMQLEIAVQQEKVEVQDSGTQLDVSGAGNASSVVLKGKDLDALSDDPDELSEELQALAGPSAGPNGGQIYIDGFTGGQLPPKSSIREIRINQNPFSAEYEHLDYQLNTNNTVTLRYQYEREAEMNNGIGTFSLPSQATNNFSTEHQVQFSDTQVVNPKVINEIRFRFAREENRGNALDLTPTINVNGAFVGGGNSSGTNDDIQDRYELQNYISIVHNSHFIKLGSRLRVTKDINVQDSGFNGGFTFGVCTVEQITQQSSCAQTPPATVCDPKSDSNCTQFTGL